MNVLDAAEVIKSLYRNSSSDEDAWRNALRNFSEVLQKTDNSDELEACILSDENWELSVDERFALLQKAKFLGANSFAFLKDYHGYMAAHLHPSEEKTAAQEQLKKLTTSS